MAAAARQINSTVFVHQCLSYNQRPNCVPPSALIRVSMGTAVLPSSIWNRLSSLATATSSPLLDQQQLTLRLMQLESRSTRSAAERAWRSETRALCSSGRSADRALSQHLKLLLLADAGALRLSTLQALTLVMEETGAHTR